MNFTEADKAKSFNSVADLYDKARPGYPPELAKDLLALARMPGTGSVLEVGCGTGKATILFAPYGYSITCLEPGERLGIVAAQNLIAFRNVRIMESRFEDWDGPENSFDLLIAAQSFHWVEREVAFDKAARLLKPGAALGLFWNREPDDESDAPYRPAFDDAYARYAPELDGPGALEEWVDEQKAKIESSGLFGPTQVRRYPWRFSYDANSYLELLSTYSDHILLPDENRRALFHALREEIERLGGRITKKYVAVLFFAKRR
jgi:SAM-dependent methyltransferase